MFNLIPVSLLIMSLGGIVYIISNHLSEFSVGSGDEEENDGSFRFKLKAHFAEWMNQLPLDGIKNQSLSLTQKLLHRCRLVLLKMDNHLMKLIDKISHREKIATPGFWDEFTKNHQKEKIVLSIMKPETKINLKIKKSRK